MTGTTIEVNFTERCFLIYRVTATMMAVRVVSEVKRCRPFLVTTVRPICSPGGLKRDSKQKKNE